ncbi:hypothetical protein [Aquisphaera insulae]|uniref:hypothetical protein n=1 Tax=Aquisphaera insulae TaxID=2712864 RepID=UPI0013EB1CF5|nr:hypothetical protein [Aquisphaera insulae]
MDKVIGRSNGTETKPFAGDYPVLGMEIGQELSQIPEFGVCQGMKAAGTESIHAMIFIPTEP